MNKNKVNHIENAINAWLDTYPFPSEFRAYINKFKGSLISNIISAVDFSDEKFDDTRLLELIARDLSRILDMNGKILRSRFPFGKVKVEEFKVLYDDLDRLFSVLIGAKYK
jgi:hypothetical protein